MESDRADVSIKRWIGRDLTLRPATPDDLDAISALEICAFEYPWPRNAFAQEFENRLSTITLACDGSEDVVAYIVYWIVEDELHVLNIAVHPSHHREGIGRALMEHVEALCVPRQIHYITLEVRYSNVAAITLYETLGYETIHQRKRYYTDNAEDALVMAKVL